MTRTRWQDKRPRYALRTERTIPAERRAAVRDFLAWYRRRYPARHHVEVEVYHTRRLVKAHQVGAPPSIGLFYYPHHPDVSRWSPKVYVAARLRRTPRVLQTLAHELSHYEEWARTGSSTERGKDQRADALLRQYYADRRGVRSIHVPLMEVTRAAA